MYFPSAIRKDASLYFDSITAAIALLHSTILDVLFLYSPNSVNMIIASSYFCADIKGNIIDSYGNRSNSIDCIVLSPSHPYTVDPVNGKASVILADGVDFAIEVKPDLAQKTEIERGLEQIRSVKRLRRVRTGLASTPEEIERAKQIPGFIFSDATYVNTKTLINNIVDYYVNNSVPKSEQFDLIVVNNRVIITNSSQQTKFHRKDFEGMLAFRCVLRFINADIRETIAVLRQNAGSSLQYLKRKGDLIIKVHPMLIFQCLLIGGIDLVHLGG